MEPYKVSQKMYVVFVGGYVATLLSLYGLRLVTAGDGPWWLAFASVWEAWWYAPLPLLLVGGMVWRPSKYVVLVLLVPCLLWGEAFGGLFWPRSGGEGELSVGVLSFNVRYSGYDPAVIAAIIEEAGADIVGIQELTTELDAYLATELASIYPYQLTTPAVTGPWGSGVFSRYPLTLVSDEGDAYGFLHTQIVSFTYPVGDGEEEVYFFNVHTTPPQLLIETSPLLPVGVPRGYGAWPRHEQIREVRAQLDEISEPVILVCDCNMTPASYDYDYLTANLSDAFAEAGWGWGHTFHFEGGNGWLAGIPLIRIDYIFYSEHWGAYEARVLPRGSSDHRALYAQLGFEGEGKER
ncbi:MAG TPA: endonuclease/exonuclease/phosphatase family protein [Anaerolineae bacterium]|nr:endonuclease/exonuclease/phosphatase family protein [Anaerolineae bacterium]